MTVDNRRQDAWQTMQAENAAKRGDNLNSGDGGGTSGGMESRVTRLEVTVEHLREDTAEIKTSLKEILAKLTDGIAGVHTRIDGVENGLGGNLTTLNNRVDGLATKDDLRSWKWQWTAICVAAIAIIVGGIIGGLSWIQPEPTSVAAPAPVVITIPAPVAPAAPS